MKRARSQSGERTTTENDSAVRTEQQDQTLHMSLEEIIERCEAIDTEAARQIAQAAQRLMQTSDKSSSERQKEIRTLCTAWNVQRRCGKRGERPLGVLRQELQAKLAKDLSELHSAGEPRTPMSPPSPLFSKFASREFANR